VNAVHWALEPGYRRIDTAQAHGIAALTAPGASAMCSHDADTPAAASLRKMATRHGHEGTPEMNARPNIVLVHGAWADGYALHRHPG